MILIGEVIRISVFGVGLCLLEIGLMRSIQKVYDKTNGKFIVSEFQALVDAFEKKFSNFPLLVDLLKLMLVLNHERRKNFRELKEELPNWYSLFAIKNSSKNSINDGRRQNEENMNTSKQNKTETIIENRLNQSRQNERESSKSEILQFFNIKEDEIKPDDFLGNIPNAVSQHVPANKLLTEYLNDIDEKKNDVNGLKNPNNDLFTLTSQNVPQQKIYSSALNEQDLNHTQKTTIVDSRTNLNDDLLESNGVERYLIGQSNVLLKSQIDVKYETNEQGQLVERTYVRYVPVDDEREKKIAKMYIEHKNNQGKNSSVEREQNSSVFNVTEYQSSVDQSSKYEMNYSRDHESEQ